MTAFGSLTKAAKAYILTVVTAGILLIAHSIYVLDNSIVSAQWFVLAALTLLTGSFTVKVPTIAAYLSVSEAFVLVSALMFGPAGGTVTVLLECLVIAFWMKSHRNALHKILFSTAAATCAIWISSKLFFLLSGFPPLAKTTIPLQSLFAPLFVFTLSYFLLNSWLVAVAVGFETNKPPTTVWWDNFVWLGVNYFSGASLAALLVTYARALDASVLAVIVPLLVVSYLTFRTAMGRVEDTNKHLSELNRLYLSTIETLAMAIDAKDQVTHGHIRRVQAFAVGLAKHIGVTDDKLLKSIEAAALLHDMGKLAVPEHILNKPGKLTPAEFDKMKEHANIGADILSAIEFPYPVVPIVRHHHENWNGSGYPNGLRGTAIPIGARILSVVDCFDALTSDRPYRPRLTNEDAFDILKDRRGSMYDPLIVDAFLRVHQVLAAEIKATDTSGAMIKTIPNTSHPINSDTSDRIGLNVASNGASGAAHSPFTLPPEHRHIAEIGDNLTTYLHALIPYVQLALFLYDRDTDEVVLRHAMGNATPLLAHLRIPLGQRMTGWVAANRQVIVNSDATLDLGDIASLVKPSLRSCMSLPIVNGERLIGVLSLYSARADGFSSADRDIVEGIVPQLAHALERASVQSEQLAGSAT